MVSTCTVNRHSVVLRSGKTLAISLKIQKNVSKQLSSLVTTADILDVTVHYIVLSLRSISVMNKGVPYLQNKTHYFTLMIL